MVHALVIPPHLTPVGTDVLTNLYRLGVYTEDILASIYFLGDGLADSLAKKHSLLTMLVILSMTYLVGNSTRTFCIQPIEELVLTVNTQCLCRNGKSHYLQMREGGYDTVAGYISLLIYLISCKFLTYLKNLSELCHEVAHIYDNST